jgi:hypothetical protein
VISHPAGLEVVHLWTLDDYILSHLAEVMIVRHIVFAVPDPHLLFKKRQNCRRKRGRLEELPPSHSERSAKAGSTRAARRAGI